MRKVLFAVLALALVSSVAIEKSSATEQDLTIRTMQSGDPPPSCQPHVKCPPSPRSTKSPRK